MKVLLLIPPYITTDSLVSSLYPLPLGPLSIASYLRRYGHDVAIKDFVATKNSFSVKPPESFKGLGNPPYIHYGFSWEYITSWVKENINNYDVIGVSSLPTPISDGTYKLIDIIHEFKNPNVKLVAGGQNATCNPKGFKERTKVDSVIIGEGELAFLNLMRDLKANISRDYYKHDYIDDLDFLPYPAWDLIDFNDYPKVENKLRVVLDTSRGCPHNCTFCSVKTIWSNKWRPHSPNYVINHILHLYITYNIKYFTFIDDNFLIDRDRAIKILKGLIKLKEKKIIKGCTFMFEEGMQVTQAMDKELIYHLYEAGFKDLRVGLEALNPLTIKETNKPFQIKDFEQVIEVFNSLGKTPKIFYILGFPFDTIESMIRYIIEFSKYKVKIRANNLKIYPNTQMCELYNHKGYIPKNYDWRLSTFYTPAVNDFTMKDIKNLKAILRAVEFCNEHDFNIFFDDIKSIASKFSTFGYQLLLSKEGLKLQGNCTIWRADSKIKTCCKLLAFRLGIQNVKSKSLGDNTNIYFDNGKHSVYNDVMSKVLRDL